MTSQLQGSIAGEREMADAMEWQREIDLGAQARCPWRVPEIVPPCLPLLPPKPDDPAGAGLGNRFREISLMIVTCTIPSSHRIPRNQDRPFKNKLEKFAFRVSYWNGKTQLYILMFPNPIRCRER